MTIVEDLMICKSLQSTKQEAQLMLTTGSTRLAVSRGQQTWYHFGSIVHCDFSLTMWSAPTRVVRPWPWPCVSSLSLVQSQGQSDQYSSKHSVSRYNYTNSTLVYQRHWYCHSASPRLLTDLLWINWILHQTAITGHNYWLRP